MTPEFTGIVHRMVGPQPVKSGYKPWASQSNGLVGVQSLNPVPADQQARMRSAAGLKNAMSDVGQFLSDNAYGLIGLGDAGINLAQNFMSASQLQDTNNYDDAMSNIGQVGRNDYGSLEELSQGYDDVNQIPVVNYDDIRGMNTGQQIASVGSAIATGASAGAAFGPLGALAGGIVGLGTGLGGIFKGNRDAREKQAAYETGFRAAQDISMSNLNAKHEGLLERDYRNRVANIAKDGGKMEKRSQSIEEFAARALRRPMRRDMDNNRTVIREHCNGGTLIRFK